MKTSLFTLNENSLRDSLISRAGNALVTLHTGLDYVIKPRTYGDIRNLLTGTYQTMGLMFRLEDVLYAGAESATLPNITAFPTTWTAHNALHVLPTSFGHYQEDPTEKPLAFLELYEVVSGRTVMIFDKPEEPFVTAIVGKSGDKILSPNRAIHTIFNLSPDRALVLLDLANSRRHCSHKEIQKASGPILLMAIQESTFIVKLSPAYINRSDGFGVSLPSGQDTFDVRFPLNGIENIGQHISDALLSGAMREQIRALGIHVVAAEEIDVAAALQVGPPQVHTSLHTVTKTAPSPVQHYFFGEDAG